MGHVACMGDKKIHKKFWPESLDGRDHICRWEGKTGIELEQTGCRVVDLINMSQDRDWWWTLCEHANEPLGSIEGNFFTS